MRLALGAPLLSGGLGLALGCGPSFQAVYEGNARFEHCYALDESPKTPMREKAACWREWSERYTYGQTRDRVQYATTRYVALTEARALPTDEAMMNAAPGESRQSTITAPAPTNAFAPPPKILEPSAEPRPAPPPTNALPQKAVDDPKPADPSPAAAKLPAAACAEECGTAFRGCSAGCPEDAGAKASKVCQRCQPSYRACMRACFK